MEEEVKPNTIPFPTFDRNGFEELRARLNQYLS